MIKKIPSNYSKQIIEEFVVNKLTTGQIAKKYGLKQISIQKFLQKNKLSKSVSEGMNKHNLDQNLFVNIDEEWKAYFLGWMYSDGNIYIKSKKHTISLCITEEDKYILDYFNCKIFKCKKRLNYRKAKVKKGTSFLAKPLWRFQIDSKNICRDLISKGLTPNKSLSIEFPSYISNELMPHFIRGLFEGDGCIQVNNKYSKTIQIFSASKTFINSLQFFFKEEINIRVSIYVSKSKVYSIRFGKKEEVQKFKTYIYNNCEQYLKRKYGRFDDI